MVAVLDLSRNYQGLRIGIASSFLILGVLSWMQGYKMWTFLLGFSAVLFNPIAPLGLTSSLWRWVDVGGIAVLAFFAFEVTDPYFKGARFEHAVETLFSPALFVIRDKTRDLSKFLNRIVESDTYPDFLFRSQRTQKEFAVECKWRKHWVIDAQGTSGMWWNRKQDERYRAYEQRMNVPVFVVFGIGGTPGKPENIYFVRLAELHGRVFIPQQIIMTGQRPADFIHAWS